MSENSHLLKTVSHEHAFHLHNGRALKNIHELQNALVSMDDATFHHHVTKDRNDFSSWIEHVFHEKELSGAIQKLRTRDAISKKISEVLKEMAKREEPKKAEEKVEEKPQKKAILSRIQKMIPKRQKKEAPKSTDIDIKTRLDAILDKEKEISYKESKLLEIEERIEKKIGGGVESTNAFFSKEFVQGIVTGFLITLIGVLAYVKFYLQA